MRVGAARGVGQSNNRFFLPRLLYCRVIAFEELEQKMKKGRRRDGDKVVGEPEEKRPKLALSPNPEQLQRKQQGKGSHLTNVKGYLLIREVLKRLPKSGVCLGQVCCPDISIDPRVEAEQKRYQRSEAIPIPSPPFEGLEPDEDLAMTLARLTDVASFWCGGKMVLPSCYEQTRVSNESVQGGRYGFPCTWLKPDITKTLEICKPAPFGDMSTQSTVYDPSVRKAWEYAFNRSWRDWPQFIGNIMTHIRKAFNLSFANISAYKLNVYGEGGFFKPHRDTPVNSMSVATMVICLPSKFEGGEFIVQRKNSKIKVFDWAKHSGDENVIQWAAFFTDSVHEVKPVTKGIVYNTMLFIDFQFRLANHDNIFHFHQPI